MPRVKKPNVKSLFNLCTEFVACNLDHWSNPLETANKLNTVHVPEHSPFEKLPLIVLEQVIDLIYGKLLLACRLPPSYEMGKLKKQLFELLITPHLRSLDLSMGELNDVSHILNFASLRCLNLKVVRLVCPSQCVDVFVHLCAVKFERLQVLNISNTDAGDSCLQILGMYCKDLRELNLLGCEKITDAGIEGLCVSVNHLGKEDQRLGQCKSIETLFIGETKITKKGIQTALKNLPYLKLLKKSRGSSNPVSVQLLAEMHQPDSSEKRSKDICKYSLNSLILGDDTPIPYIRGSLGLVASLCPSVRFVEINLIPELMDSDLLGLLCLGNVNELILSGSTIGNKMVTFEGGVVPLFKGFGSSLKVLTLSCLSDVNIRAIIDFCPKLQSLFLFENESYATVGTKEDTKPNRCKRIKMEQSVLKNLEKLNVISCNKKEGAVEKEIISSEDLLSLFSSPSLINIVIAACDNLTDYVFKRASEIHQFLSLEELSINVCHSMTRKGIDFVMNKKTPLNAIEINFCQEFQDDDIALLIWKTLSEKWQLSIEYDEKKLTMDEFR